MKRKIFNTTHFWVLTTFYATYFLVMIFQDPQFSHLMLSLLYGGVLSFASLFFLNVLEDSIRFFREEFLVFIRYTNRRVKEEKEQLSDQPKAHPETPKEEPNAELAPESHPSEGLRTGTEVPLKVPESEIARNSIGEPMPIQGGIELKGISLEEEVLGLPNIINLPSIKRVRGRPRKDSPDYVKPERTETYRGYKAIPVMGDFIFTESEDWKTILKQYNTLGEILLILMAHYNKSNYELGQGLNYHFKYISELVTGDAQMNKNMAKRLAEYFVGFPESFWLSLKPTVLDKSIRTWKVWVSEALPTRYKNNVSFEIVKKYKDLPELIQGLSGDLTELELSQAMGISRPLLKAVKGGLKTSLNTLDLISKYFGIPLHILIMLCYKSGIYMTPIRLIGLSLKRRKNEDLHSLDQA